MHVLMSVKVRRLEPSLYHTLDLRVQLTANFRRAHLQDPDGELAIRVRESAVRSNQARNLLGRRKGPFPSDQGQMHAHVEVRTVSQHVQRMIECLTAGHDGRAGHDALPVRLLNTAVDILMEPQIVGVHDESAGLKIGG